jgi:hypothetical protein
MKILLKKESNWHYNAWVEVETIEDIMNLVKEHGPITFQEELPGLDENGKYCETFGAVIEY